MPRLWLSYAWVDNEDEQVDFVASRLREVGLTVDIDRSQLLGGRRLWEQIDGAISHERVDAWAIYVTGRSLASQACQEELHYALDRALHARGDVFPMVGIFPAPMDHQLIPAAIRVRGYVTLKDPEWAERVRDAVVGSSSFTPPTPQPYGFRIHTRARQTVVEVWPREGSWLPCCVLTPTSEGIAVEGIYRGPRNRPDYLPGITMDRSDGGMVLGEEWRGLAIDEQVDSTMSLYAIFNGRPHRVGFGDGGATLYSIVLEP